MAVKLNATKRENLTKSATKEIRGKGHVPAVVYGKDKESSAIAVDSIALIKTVRDEGRNAIINLDIENGNTVDVILHDYQIDPLRDELVHADFYIVNMSEEMDVEVPVRLEGEAPGDKEGGVLQQPLYDIQVRAKPRDIPEEIIVDVSKLEIGDSIMVSDLTAGGSYEFLTAEDTTVATVVPPTVEEDLEADEADEAQEPTLVDAEREAQDEEQEKQLDEEK